MFADCMDDALKYASVDKDPYGDGPNLRRKLIVRSCKHSVSLAAAQACSSDNVAAAVLARNMDIVFTMLDESVDPSVRINAVGLCALLAAHKERGMKVATIRDNAIIKQANACFAEARDSDAYVLRMLKLVHNLLVSPEPRSLLIHNDILSGLAHVVDVLINPMMLFETVKCFVALFADGTDNSVIAEMERSGALARVALLARAEKGVPEPSKDEKEGEQEAPKEKDYRVSYEATRVLLRVMKSEDDHFACTLLDNEKGCIGMFKRLAATPYDVLHDELASTLKSLLDRDATRAALSRAAQKDKNDWDELLSIISGIKAFEQVGALLKSL